MAASWQLQHVVDGPPDAPVLMLCPALGSDRSIWEAPAASLAERYRVIRCDLPGHGGSPAYPGPYAISDLGSALVSVLDEHDLATAHLGGISIGAMASIWVAQHAPERVSRLVLCCTSARFSDEGRERYRGRASAVRADGLDAIADGVLERWLTPRFAAANPRGVQALRAMLLAVEPEAYVEFCGALAVMDLSPELASISSPTLVISGSEDLATPPEDGQLIADAIPDARFELLETAHLSIVEQPERTVELIGTFLEETR